MSAKKRHEVEHLAAFISHVARSAGVNNLIDLGAGQGYLSSVLALRYGHNVLGVDTDPVQTSGAIRRRATLFKRVRHKMESPGRLMYLNKHMTATDTFNESVDWSAERWGLIGLHTCGDLSPITLRMWEASSATLVINVGCCYNHISEETPDTGPVTPGFPMSQAVAAHNVHLGWTAKMLACQSTCRWTTQGDRAKEAFRRHVYRALLQEWLVSATGGVSPVVSVHTSKVRRGGLPTFAMYWREAVGALLRDHGPTADIEAWYSRRIAEGALKQIALVWTLRAMMAEAIESLILVDRYMWVREQQSVQRTVLFPLFDHVESPRNCVIVGIKQ
ncbi:methyltransferase domain-containing protein [Blastocladiella britannica]|nr:methyltransferase domain-containing protein [Blastocladiella britannica]